LNLSDFTARFDISAGSLRPVFPISNTNPQID
jgi:hypothetical protein